MGLIGFLQHVLDYFGRTSTSSPVPQAQPQGNREALLHFHVHIHDSLYIPYHGPLPPPSGLQLHVLVDGNHYIPYYFPSSNSFQVPVPALPAPAPIAASAPAPAHISGPGPTPALRTVAEVHTPRPSTSSESKEKHTYFSGNLEKQVVWDGWPDGPLQLDFTYTEFDETKRLQVHWATSTHGDRKGSNSALDPEDGKPSHRTCQGIIRCDTPDCPYLIRPQTKEALIHKQLTFLCICGAKLQHARCPARMVSLHWRGGVRFRHNTYHNHPRPTHILHVNKSQRTAFEDLVIRYPDAGPLCLVTGLPNPDGTRTSVADISPVWGNTDRVAKDKQKALQRQGKSRAVQGIAITVEELSDFADKYPDFMVGAVHDSEVVVVSLQTSWMRSQLLPEVIGSSAPATLRVPRDADDPVNGILTDAAHGWWRNRKSLLIVSSVYSWTLLRWVPVLFTFSDSASHLHYKHHFLALMETMEEACSLENIKLQKAFFASVMDFSEAEKQGFVMAYVEFWLSHEENELTEEELMAEAEALLKGCRQHFNSGITRVKKISGVVPVHLKAAFQHRAESLVGAETTEEFIRLGEFLPRDFPKISS
ncbi:hypothetical protein BKA70DRAFT_1449290 [Coprinopsis sp. MPI-PUGE-AT-0042]|nr:hypothetical protein BKA70DRAFT_1449290 [Coprinopsis sp. MPI-PUGE-AT-0042]